MLMGLALFALIYGGLLAWRQTDLKRMIAYSSVSHMGVVLLGIATLNQAGITGAMMQMISHGLVAGSLFLLIGLLYQRTNTRDINDYGSLIQITPRFAFFIIFAFMAAIGIPGTSGFVAELHVLIGGFEQWQWWVIWLSIGVVISAAYGFRTVGKLFTGPTTLKMREVTDLQGSEMIAASLLAFLILFLGLYPAPALDLIEQSVNSFTFVFSGGVK
jgi:NADH-quinone oxidoreductase subunit M